MSKLSTSVLWSRCLLASLLFFSFQTHAQQEEPLKNFHVALSSEYAPWFQLKVKDSDVHIQQSMGTLGVTLKFSWIYFLAEGVFALPVQKHQDEYFKAGGFSMAIGGMINDKKRLKFPVHLIFTSLSTTDEQQTKRSFSNLGIELGARFYVTDRLALSARAGVWSASHVSLNGGDIEEPNKGSAQKVSAGIYYTIK